jgi:hypothetical protein
LLWWIEHPYAGHASCIGKAGPSLSELTITKKWPKLRYAVNDANGIEEALVSRFGFKPDHIPMRISPIFTMKMGRRADANPTMSNFWRWPRIPRAWRKCAEFCKG